VLIEHYFLPSLPSPSVLATSEAVAMLLAEYTAIVILDVLREWPTVTMLLEVI
jgi:hypothetical protein